MRKHIAAAFCCLLSSTALADTIKVLEVPVSFGSEAPGVGWDMNRQPGVEWNQTIADIEIIEDADADGERDRAPVGLPAQPAGYCNPKRWMAAADVALANANVPVGNWNKIIYHFPPSVQQRCKRVYGFPAYGGSKAWYVQANVDGPYKQNAGLALRGMLGVSETWRDRDNDGVMDPAPFGGLNADRASEVWTEDGLPQPSAVYASGRMDAVELQPGSHTVWRWGRGTGTEVYKVTGPAKTFIVATRRGLFAPDEPSDNGPGSTWGDTENDENEKTVLIYGTNPAKKLNYRIRGLKAGEAFAQTSDQGFAFAIQATSNGLQSSTFRFVLGDVPKVYLAVLEDVSTTGAPSEDPDVWHPSVRVRLMQRQTNGDIVPARGVFVQVDTATGTTNSQGYATLQLQGIRGRDIVAQLRKVATSTSQPIRAYDPGLDTVDDTLVLTCKAAACD